ncbi:radical SAM protein [Thermodesulforhabdus norvegica]|uniref:Radical SAM superfamily enzyme, MoaA/NifB/PqqE/SkfB family n=1 Tax=Thermodesulforhabdus norvegica TaxID=39841 RepID=A0A1I4SIQ4_9BACT|nr:radical SAM protein [Thermodesulforhabdus norvegica]SFM64322.1 Radical SAM superfamily enzyme, MoaA/NifB/PqqE/SkfB family [Thermodesulforhabdus norvegica]
MKIPEFLKRWRIPRLDWIQIEISSVCTASCVYCPRTVFGKNWKRGLMSPRVFGSVAGAFKYTGFVHLQGWGEPLLHPMFFDFVREARKAGCTVGTTTSGQTLSSDRAKKFVEEGPDVMAFSVAGCSEINDIYRKGTSFSKVMKSIEAISGEKERLGRRYPVLHIAYMLLMSALDELRRIGPVFGATGVQEVVISTLNYVPHPSLKNESFFYCDTGKREKAREILMQLLEESGSGGIPRIAVNFPPFNKGRGCLEKATRSVFVSHEGSVHPCVYLGIPLKNPAGDEAANVVSFGNLEYEDLSEIWHRPSYREWRKNLEKIRQHDLCRDCGRFCP